MILLKNIVKDYGQGSEVFHALNGVSLSFGEKGFVAILGHSGCGKTTLLNILGGLDRPTSGNMIVDGKDTSSFSTNDFDSYRNFKIGFIFQEYNLLPEMSALNNVKIALDIRRVGKESADKLARTALKKVGLENKADNKPHQMSGGQCQRVSIARAIVGNPSIILADEPTGALDSKSGRDVMEILKSISKDRLVIMVTHNEELAKQYTDRIIRLSDGKVISDTDAIEGNNLENPLSDEKKKKVGLGFAGAIKTGVRHTVNRLGRSMSVALTTTFGIMALGFSLALANGFSFYVNRVNQVTGSNAPIVINAYSTSSAGASWSNYNQTEEYPGDDSIYPTYSPTGTETYKYNNFTDKFYNYLQELKNDGILTDYKMKRSEDDSLKVIASYPSSLNVENSGVDGDSGYKTVNVSMRSTMSSGTGGNSAVANTVFHPLINNYEENYDLLAGKLPTSKDELVMIVDYRNAVSFKTLKELGFYNPSDTQEDVYDATLTTHVKPVTFDKILGKEYKIFSIDDCYVKASDFHGDVKNTAFPSFENIEDDDGKTKTINRYFPKTTMQLSNENPNESDKTGVTAKIVGIIRPKKTIKKGIMNSGIGFVQDSNTDEKNGLLETIRSFNQSFSMLDDFKNAFVRKTPYKYDSISNVYIKQDKISSIDMAKEISNEFFDGNKLKEEITYSKIQEILEKYFTAYIIYSSNFNPSNPYDVNNYTDGYLYKFKAYANLRNYFTIANSLGLDFTTDELKGITLTDTTAIESFLRGLVKDFLNEDVESYYNKVLALGQLAYVQANVSTIVLLPNSISEAKVVIEKLNEFNDYSKYDNTIEGGDPYHAKDKSEVIAFTDTTWDMTQDIGQAIDMTNIILEVFAVITLIGSGIVCISVTNMSVLERKKEIGLLRSLGASQKDIGWVFESESFIVGLVGGLLGCFLTYILTFPINVLVNTFYPSYNVGNIADMAWWHPIVLVLLAVVLTTISALIPSLKAAKKKPVECLRSDQ